MFQPIFDLFHVWFSLFITNLTEFLRTLLFGG